MQDKDYQAEIESNGFALRSSILTVPQVASLIAKIEELSDHAAASHARGSSGDGNRPSAVYAMRNIFANLPGAAALAESPSVRALVEPLLGPDCFAVRGILFDKVPGANWKVAWHQDLAVALRDRIETPGFAAALERREAVRMPILTTVRSYYRPLIAGILVTLGVCLALHQQQAVPGTADRCVHRLLPDARGSSRPAPRRRTRRRPRSCRRGRRRLGAARRR